MSTDTEKYGDFIFFKITLLQVDNWYFVVRYIETEYVTKNSRIQFIPHFIQNYLLSCEKCTST